jgi:hypothetical protein
MSNMSSDTTTVAGAAAPPRQTIAIVNASTAVSDQDLGYMVAAINKELPAFCRAWNLPTTQAYAVPLSAGATRATYTLTMMDDADVDDALGYHDEINNKPYGKVFARTVLSNGGVLLYGGAHTPTVAQTLSHEVYEILVDFNCNIWWQARDGRLYAAEVSDPVQGNIVKVSVGAGVTVGLSDYVLPSWCDPQETRRPFNALNTLTRPFQLARGGYVIVMRGNQVENVFGTAMPEWLRRAKAGSPRLQTRHDCVSETCTACIDMQDGSSSDDE